MNAAGSHSHREVGKLLKDDERVSKRHTCCSFTSILTIKAARTLRELVKSMKVMLAA